MKSLLGYWVHHKTGGDLRPWSAEEIGGFFDHFTRIQPGASLFHEILEWAVEAKRRVPTCNVVYRRYIDPKRGVTEGNIWRTWSVQQHIDEFAPYWRPGLILNMWNEPNPDAEEQSTFARKFADVADGFGRLGIPIVGPNQSVGTPREDAETIARLEPIWDVFDRWYNLHVYGIHEYGTHRGMIFQEGGDYDVYPWRVGRTVELIQPQVIARGHKGFRVIVTEYGGDYAFDGQNRRGYRDYWGGRRYGQELALGVQMTKRPYVLGYCTYKKGNSSEWEDFDVMGDTDLEDEVEDAAKDGRTAPVIVTTPHAPQPPPLPEPPGLDDPRWVEATAITGATGTHLRQQPSTSSRSLGVLGTGDLVQYIDDTAYGQWYAVRHGTRIGFSRRDVIDFEKIANPPVPDAEALRHIGGQLRRIGAEIVEIAGLLE